MSSSFRPMRALFVVALAGSTILTTHHLSAAPAKAKKAVHANGKTKKPAAKKTGDSTQFGLSGLPIQFYSTWEYATYIIFDKTMGEKPTVTRGVGGTLSLGPKGTYEKSLNFAGPYGPYTFSETGKYRLEQPKKDGAVQTGKITFTYLDSKGKTVVYGGKYNFHLKALSLVLTLNESPDGKEIFGLFVKGTEKLKRHFDENGNVVFE